MFTEGREEKLIRWIIKSVLLQSFGCLGFAMYFLEKDMGARGSECRVMFLLFEDSPNFDWYLEFKLHS